LAFIYLYYKDGKPNVKLSNTIVRNAMTG